MDNFIYLRGKGKSNSANRFVVVVVGFFVPGLRLLPAYQTKTGIVYKPKYTLNKCIHWCTVYWMIETTNYIVQITSTILALINLLTLLKSVIDRYGSYFKLRNSTKPYVANLMQIQPPEMIIKHNSENINIQSCRVIDSPAS